MEYDEATREEEQEENAFPPPRFVNLDGVQPSYANFIHILHDQYAFHLVFGQIIPPIIRTEEDRTALLEDGLAANVVGRLIVTPSTMRDFINYMNEQLAMFEADHESTEIE